jgi:hypothetical protein
MADCQVDGCNRPSRCLKLCTLHYQRLRTHGDPLAYKKASGDRHGRWKGDEVGYIALHQRLGDPKQHGCLNDCGNQATEWAYDHGDLNEKIDPKTGSPFSIDPQFYMALCHSCHVKWDQR